MPMDPAQMASGGGQPQPPMPPASSVQSSTPSNGPIISPGQAPGGIDSAKVEQLLKTIIPQAVDNAGYVSLLKLATIWPQISQQYGINMPFQTFLELIGKDQSLSDLVDRLIVSYGLAGIIDKDGNRISAEQLQGQQMGATGAPGGIG